MTSAIKKIDKNPTFACYVIGIICFLMALCIKVLPKPEKINTKIGYRSALSMKCQENWEFANKKSADLIFYIITIICSLQILVHIFVRKIHIYSFILFIFLIFLYLIAFIGAGIYTEFLLKQQHFC